MGAACVEACHGDRHKHDTKRGIGGQRGSSHSHGSGGVGFPRSSSAADRVSDQMSINVSSGPNGRKRYEDALLYMGSTK